MSDPVNEATEEGEPWDLLADALGSLDELDEPEDDPVLDIKEQFGLDEEGDGLHKIPLAQSQNLLKIRRAVQALEEGQVDKETFLNTVRPMGRSLENGLKLIATSAVQKQIAELSQEERELFEDAEDSIHILHQGITKMLEFGQSENIEHVREGLKIVEEGFVELDEIQDDALEIVHSTDD